MGEPTSRGLNFISFAEFAAKAAVHRIPALDQDAMRLVLLLHRVSNSVVYDIESTVHRPAGWSWSGFRLLFTLWIAGPVDATTAAQLAGMSRAAVSNLVNTLERDGLVNRDVSAQNARAVTISMTPRGERRLRAAYRQHNQREAVWAGNLTAAERRTLIDLLQKLGAAAQADWVSRRD